MLLTLYYAVDYLLYYVVHVLLHTASTPANSQNTTTHTLHNIETQYIEKQSNKIILS